ncbi:MAG: hypothetical protein ACYDB2_00210 [Acidimicrobiales bacterium]
MAHRHQVHDVVGAFLEYDSYETFIAGNDPDAVAAARLSRVTTFGCAQLVNVEPTALG